MDKRLLRYAGGGGDDLPCSPARVAVHGAGRLAGGDVAGLVACGVISPCPASYSVCLRPV